MPSIKNYLLLVLALTVLGLSVLAWKQYQELVALRTAALTNGERADWQKRVWAAQKRVQRLESQLDAAHSGKLAATGAEASEASRAMPPRPDFGRMMSGIATVMDRPEAARLLALQQKTQVDARYAALFRRLGLAPDKLAQLKSLLADRLSAPIDVLAVAGQQGINPIQDPPAFRQLVQNTQSEIDGKIQALLDPGAYAQYQNYIQTEPQRAVVSQLQQALSYTDNPLSSTQVDQLVQILAQTSPARVGPSSGPTVAYVARAGSAGGGATFAMATPPPDGVAGAGASLVTDATIAQAQGVLSPAQLQALQEIQQQQQAAAQLREQMFQHVGGGLLPAPVTSGPADLTPAPGAGG